jgi:phosphatidate cytidylyltransferase
MLIKRVLASLVLAIIGIPAIILGGIYYYFLITLLLAIAAWEFGRIFTVMDHRPSMALLVGGVVVLCMVRSYFPELAAVTLTLLVLASMTYHLMEYEKGRDKAASDFAITTAGIIYLGWVGAYLIDVRKLPDGLWWLLLVLPAVWLADTGAYFIGKRFGKHLLCPRLSPKKTWEGYWAGVIAGILGTLGFIFLWRAVGGFVIPLWKGLLLGAVLSLLTTLGDLGESMFKRQAGVKDSSNIIPGHGGVLDRLDSWIWAAALGYFLITWFLI